MAVGRQIILCDDRTCIFNDNGTSCLKSVLHIAYTETNEFEQGKRVAFNDCQDYRDRSRDYVG